MPKMPYDADSEVVVVESLILNTGPSQNQSYDCCYQGIRDQMQIMAATNSLFPCRQLLMANVVVLVVVLL